MSKNGNTIPPVTDPGKARRVKKELKRLADLFEGIDENRMDFVQRQLEQLAWLNISIIELQARIDKYGTLVAYDNGGGQSGIKPNPDLKTLIDYQKLANAITRTLNSVIPIKETSTTGGKLMDFFLNDDPEDQEERQREEAERAKAREAEFRRAEQILKEKYENN